MGVPTLSRPNCKFTICGSSHVFQDLTVNLRFVGVPTFFKI
ncbi:hypothetical protein LEP1GSC020_4060 [Leptospira interrogans serovar Grippotyphosa str. 2006006986]|uniref:Uncharacterized protein n=2 Tax=Leptospira interrogans TaxID=173 RepID=A0A0F6HG39_LEPIR|nr:hypothetical protein LEP1GSC104_1847 [Leptospira interrogans str. UI 12621]EKO85101.1 hypothetical protein LEP1GSC009_1423 [Leptospira interrogans serovar Grippotyphosa str. Andaman]EKP85187.1 hypothetical protein LEP1GSC020_4060 [Leptospira interrogans serovar Grippotyphosa str. 2006006986]EMJ37579.1 hypothetical protein LEP1GSC079_0474 [Leptospira interrogans str. FPW1039]